MLQKSTCCEFPWIQQLNKFHVPAVHLHLVLSANPIWMRARSWVSQFGQACTKKENKHNCIFFWCAERFYGLKLLLRKLVRVLCTHAFVISQTSGTWRFSFNDVESKVDSRGNGRILCMEERFQMFVLCVCVCAWVGGCLARFQRTWRNIQNFHGNFFEKNRNRQNVWTDLTGWTPSARQLSSCGVGFLSYQSSLCLLSPAVLLDVGSSLFCDFLCMDNCFPFVMKLDICLCQSTVKCAKKPQISSEVWQADQIYKCPNSSHMQMHGSLFNTFCNERNVDRLSLLRKCLLARRQILQNTCTARLKFLNFDCDLSFHFCCPGWFLWFSCFWSLDLLFGTSLNGVSLMRLQGPNKTGVFETDNLVPMQRHFTTFAQSRVHSRDSCSCASEIDVEKRSGHFFGQF